LHHQDRPPPHLLPEKTYKTKHAPGAITQTEQTMEHYEDQEDVCSEHDDEGKFVAFYVGRHATLVLK
jgi:hypothetical protein